MGCIDKKRLDSTFDACTTLSAGAYVYVCELKSNVSRWSKGAVDFFGLPDEYIQDAEYVWGEHVHPEDRDYYSNSIMRTITGVDPSHDIQYRAKTCDGDYVLCSCQGTLLYDADGKPEYFCGTLRNNDVKGYIDEITNFRNQYGFLDDVKANNWNKLEQQIMLLGVSGFSHTNEIYGYTFGNRVLQKVADILREEVGNFGKVYRMDGTKFAIISHEAKVGDFILLYKEIKKRTTRDFYVEGHRVVLSLDAGAINVEHFDISVETIYSCLKYAYYESKNSHHGELYVLRDRLTDDNRFMIEKVNVIRNSIVDDCNGFFLCYQPIVDAKTETLKGAEALIRWKNDAYGVVPPIQFVDVLERDSLFPELGKWILKRAMLDAKKMLEKYPHFVVNVNLSYSQLEDGDFVSVVTRLLDETGFPPENLCLEITERCRLLDINLLKETFHALRNKGIKIALDDFGTGYCSIEVLREISVNTVKIDRGFIMNIEKSHSDQNTVRFISELANSFQAEVCAEGIETQEMQQILLDYKIKSLQGYYYSKPVQAEDFFKKYC